MTGRSAIRRRRWAVSSLFGATFIILSLVSACLLPSSAALAAAFQLTLADQDGRPISGTTVRAIPLAAGRPAIASTGASGVAVFCLPPGVYRFRASYLGYFFTSRLVAVPRTRRVTLTIPHRPVTAGAMVTCNGQTAPLPGSPVVVRRSVTGRIVAGPAPTAAAGKVTFSLPCRAYFFEVTSVAGTHRSADTTWEDRTIYIKGGVMSVTILHGGAPLPAVPLLLRNLSGEDLGIRGLTDLLGLASFILPAGGYLAAADHDDGVRLTAPVTVREAEVTALTFELAVGQQPAVAFRGPPRQIPDGRDLLDVPLVLSDGDGDGCRLRLEYSLDGEAWFRATLAAALRVEYDGGGGPPAVDNQASFQVGGNSPLATNRGPNAVTIRWDMGGDLPKADNVTVRLRLTVNDGCNGTVLLSGERLWAGIGPKPPGLGLSATPGDSYTPSLAVDSLGRPHVAWIEVLPDGEAVAYLRWDGFQWVDADGTGRESLIVGRTAGSICGLSLALDRQDFPRLAWDAPAEGRRALFYLRWNGGGWSGIDGQAGNAGPITDLPRDVAYPQLEVDGENHSHLLFSTFGGEPTLIFFLHLEFSRPMPVPEEEMTPAVAADWCGGAAMRLDTRGRPHLVWTEGNAMAGYALRHLQLDAGDWRPVNPAGDTLRTASPGYLPVVICGEQGELWLLWVEQQGMSTRMLASALADSGWTAPETVGPQGATLPSAAMLPGGIPAVAYVNHAGGSWYPGLQIRDEGWRPWPGLPETISTEAAPSYGASMAVGPGGWPVVAFDGHAGQNEEIYMFTPLAGHPAVDTAPPAPPGTPAVELPSGSNWAVVALGEPSADAHFQGYLIEASPSAGFDPPIVSLDWRREPRLRLLDGTTIGEIQLSGLLWGRDYFFRVVARDTFGHQSISPPAGPFTVPPDTFAPSLSVSQPAEGTVAPDTSVLIAGAVDDPEARLFLNDREIFLEGSSFRAVMALAEGANELTLRAVDASGNESVLRRQVICIPLAVDSPPPGASTGAPAIELTGTCGANVRLITLNSLVAAPEGNAFALWPVPLANGENLLVVRAHDVEGRFSERRLVLTGVTAQSETGLHALPAVGAAPLEVSLVCETGVAGAAAIFSWDPDGDGGQEIEAIGQTSLSWRFDVPGTYSPTVTVTDVSGVRQKLTATVSAHPPGRLVGSIPVSSPAGIALDGGGRLLVSERNPDGIRVFDDRLQPAGAITEGPAGVRLSAPAGVTVDDEGLIWVADSGNRRIAVFDGNGNFVGRWRWNEVAFQRITHQGPVFYAAAADSLLFRYLKVLVSGELATGGWGQTELAASSQGGVAGIGGLALGPTGKLLLTDAPSGRLLAYQDPSEGTPATSFLQPLATGLSNPGPVALSLEAGRLAVLEPGSGRILLFDAAGSPAGEIGPGAYGDLMPSGPSDLAFRQTRDGTLFYVADTGNDRVAIILLPGEDPMTPLTLFRDALRSGDVTAAVASLHPINRDKHTAFLEKIQGRLADAASWFDQVELTSMTGNLARARAVRHCTIDGTGGDFEFPIVLLKDKDGTWKILDF